MELGDTAMVRGGVGGHNLGVRLELGIRDGACARVKRWDWS